MTGGKRKMRRVRQDQVTSRNRNGPIPQPVIAASLSFCGSEGGWVVEACGGEGQSVRVFVTSHVLPPTTELFCAACRPIEDDSSTTSRTMDYLACHFHGDQPGIPCWLDVRAEKETCEKAAYQDPRNKWEEIQNCMGYIVLDIAPLSDKEFIRIESVTGSYPDIAQNNILTESFCKHR